MNAFWQGLSGREQMLIIIGGVLAGLFIALQLILSPMLSWRADQRSDMARARSLYEIVAEAAPLGEGAPAGASTNAGPARTIVSQTANDAGVAIVFINARGDNAVDVNIASVTPDALFQWLGQLRADYNIVVDTADIARDTGNPQTLRAQISMSQRGGP